MSYFHVRKTVEKGTGTSSSDLSSAVKGTPTVSEMGRTGDTARRGDQAGSSSPASML